MLYEVITERVVIFRLGRLSGVKGPGLFLIIPFIDKALKIDLRVVAIDVPKQAVITRDNVTVEVDAVVYYKVVEPGAAITQVENYMFATSTLSQTTLRDVLGQMELVITSYSIHYTKLYDTTDFSADKTYLF